MCDEEKMQRVMEDLAADDIGTAEQRVELLAFIRLAK